MKRLVILGLAALLVLGMGVFALGGDATLTIGSDCGTDDEYVGEFGAPGTTPEYEADDEVCVTITGHANANLEVTATIDGPLTHSTGLWDLVTSLTIDTTTLDPVLTNGGSVTVTIPWDGTGTWSAAVCVDVHRHGYADHAGTYTATVTINCVCV